MIAALFVAEGGCYSGLPGVDPWPIGRDARMYDGPHPVVAHPPCQRWGRYWHGSPRKPHQYAKGDDDGCFAAALASVRAWGGILEHPAHSHAWLVHGLPWPPACGGWQRDSAGGWCCQVEQGHYGHASRKATWLYAVGTDLPELIWGSSGQRIDPGMLARKGYEYARRCGIIGLAGGKRKTEIRNATPAPFRGLLLAMAASVSTERAAA